MTKTPYIVVRPGSGAKPAAAAGPQPRIDVYEAGVNNNAYEQTTGPDAYHVFGKGGEMIAVAKAGQSRFREPAPASPAEPWFCQLVGDEVYKGDDPIWYYNPDVFGVQTLKQSDATVARVLYSLSAEGPVGKTIIVTPYEVRAGSPPP